MRSTRSVRVQGSAEGIVLGVFERVDYDFPPRTLEALLATARGEVRARLKWRYDGITSIAVPADDEVAVREVLKLRSCTLMPVTTTT